MIRVKNLTCPMNKNSSLKIRSLVIPNRGGYLIFGDNGTGKTTLIRHITGIKKSAAGTLDLDGQDLNGMTRLQIAGAISYLPQTSDMEVNATVKDFIEQGLYAAKKGFFNDTVRILGLQRFLKKNFSELSGGEKQLARIARAMVPDVKYTFLDEPDSFLSRQNKTRFMELVGIFSKTRCIVIVSHDALKFKPRLKPLLELKI